MIHTWLSSMTFISDLAILTGKIWSGSSRKQVWKKALLSVRRLESIGTTWKQKKSSALSGFIALMQIVNKQHILMRLSPVMQNRQAAPKKPKASIDLC
jgi:hypothetical protein